jgi:hypothetical protein
LRKLAVGAAVAMALRVVYSVIPCHVSTEVGDAVAFSVLRLSIVRIDVKLASTAIALPSGTVDLST